MSKRGRDKKKEGERNKAGEVREGKRKKKKEKGVDDKMRMREGYR